MVITNKIEGLYSSKGLDRINKYNPAVTNVLNLKFIFFYTRKGKSKRKKEEEEVKEKGSCKDYCKGTEAPFLNLKRIEPEFGAAATALSLVTTTRFLHFLFYIK